MAERQRKGTESGSAKSRGEKAPMTDPQGGDGNALGAPGAAGGKSNGGRARSTGTSPRSTASGASRPRKPAAGDEAGIRKELRGFVTSHREGWNHEDWSQLLGQLRERGYDTSNTDEIGKQLERERIAVHLEGVQGVGPARVKKLQEEFGTLWELRNADTDRIASAGGVKSDVAERIRRSLS